MRFDWQWFAMMHAPAVMACPQTPLPTVLAGREGGLVFVEALANNAIVCAHANSIHEWAIRRCVLFNHAVMMGCGDETATQQ